jgi:hypothetical protein
MVESERKRTLYEKPTFQGVFLNLLVALYPHLEMMAKEIGKSSDE